MFERYTEAARRTLFFARYEASQLGSLSIETEHLLLGIVREGAVIPALVAASLEELRRDLKARVRFQEKVSTSVEIPFSNPTKRALQFAAEEADRLQHLHIGSEHLLLGLLREEDSGAALVLAAHGARLNELRAKVEQLPAPLEFAPRVEVRQVIDRIKALVEELAGLAPGAPAAADLVARIKVALDALPGGDGIR